MHRQDPSSWWALVALEVHSHGHSGTVTSPTHGLPALLGICQAAGLCLGQQTSARVKTQIHKGLGQLLTPASHVSAAVIHG